MRPAVHHGACPARLPMHYISILRLNNIYSLLFHHRHCCLLSGHSHAPLASVPLRHGRPLLQPPRRVHQCCSPHPQPPQNEEECAQRRLFTPVRCLLLLPCEPRSSSSLAADELVLSVAHFFPFSCRLHLDFGGRGHLGALLAPCMSRAF